MHALVRWILELRPPPRCPRCATPLAAPGSPCADCARVDDAEADRMKRHYLRDVKPLQDLKIVVKASLIVMIAASVLAYVATGGS